MGEMVQLTVEKRECAAYMARPPSAHATDAPGVLLIHAWWGLNACFRRLADRLATEGFTVLAPDLYGGEVASTIEEAERLRSHKGPVSRWKVLAAALRHLSTEVHPRPAMIGFSMGGHWALWLAASLPEEVGAVVSFYGARSGDFSGSRSSFLLHFAATDPYVSASAAAKLMRTLRSSGRPLEAHTYPGTRHWFAEDDRPEHDPEAAALAWQRTLDFLRA